MKTIDIETKYNELQNIKSSGLRFTAKVAYKINLNLSHMDDSVQSYKSAVTDCILSHGGKQKDGSVSISKDDEGYEDCVKQLNELASEDTDINIAKIKIDDLDGINLTLEQMDALMFMIQEE